MPFNGRRACHRLCFGLGRVSCSLPRRRPAELPELGVHAALPLVQEGDLPDDALKLGVREAREQLGQALGGHHDGLRLGRVRGAAQRDEERPLLPIRWGRRDGSGEQSVHQRDVLLQRNLFVSVDLGRWDNSTLVMRG